MDRQAASFPWWLLLLLCLAAFGVYARALAFDFVFDDDIQILRNPWIRDWSRVGQFFLTDVWRFSSLQTSNYYRPLHMVMHTLGFSISGMEPWGFHLINLLLHSIATLLVALLGYQLTRERMIGAASGLIFAFHPVHVESVAWIAAVPDPLCAVFYFGALLIHVKSDQGSGNFSAPVISLLYLGALFSKEMGFLLPLVILWLDWCLRRRWNWKLYTLLAASFGIYALFRIAALSRFHVHQLSLDLSVSDRIYSSIVLLAQYVAKAFVPFKLSAFHVFYPTTSPADPRFIASSLGLLLFAACAWWLRSDRKILFLAGFIFIAILPVMNLSGIGESVFSDRYLYIPSLGSCILIPLLAQKVWLLSPTRLARTTRVSAILSLSALCLAYLYVLWPATNMWRDNLTLYTETMKRSPDSATIAADLAQYYFLKGRIDESETWLLRAHELRQKSFIKNSAREAVDDVRFAAIYLSRQDPVKAIEHLEKAYPHLPNDPSVAQNLGAAYILIQKYDVARQWFERAIAINPRSEVSYGNLGYIYLQMKDYDKAIENATKALEIYPRFANAYLNLARACAAKGWKDRALKNYAQAKINDPTLAQTVDQESGVLQQLK